MLICSTCLEMLIRKIVVQSGVRIMATKQKKSFDAKVLLPDANSGRTIDQYRKNQIIFAQGDSADSIFYITERQG